MIDYEIDASALGLNPKCDICEKPVLLGQRAIQTIQGVIVRVHPDEDSELGVKEESYVLVHEECKNKVN